MNYDVHYEGLDGHGQRRTMTETAYQQIKRAIICCELEPGKQVSEEQLAEHLGLGRSAVRPALKRLTQEHLIQTKSRQRYVVAPITIKDVHDLFDVRLLVEPAAARQAARRVGSAEIELLEKLCQARYTPGDQASAEIFLRANTEFHVTVARASGNLILAEMIANLLDREERLNHVAHMLNDRNEDAYHEHHELVEALAARDGERAKEVMTAQIHSARSFVLDALMSSPSIQSVNAFWSSSAPK